MALLTSAEITAMRTTLENSMPDTAIIQTQTLTSDGQGGNTVTWAASGTVDARLGPMGMPPWEQQIAEKVEAINAMVITMPHDTTVTPKDRVVIGSRTFEVVGLSPRNEWNLAKRVIVAEVL